MCPKNAGIWAICCSRRFVTSRIRSNSAISPRRLSRRRVLRFRVTMKLLSPRPPFIACCFMPKVRQTLWPANPAEYTAFAAEIATDKAIDLMRLPLLADRTLWIQLTDYAACLDLADAARTASLEVIRYESRARPGSARQYRGACMPGFCRQRRRRPADLAPSFQRHRHPGGMQSPGLNDSVWPRAVCSATRA